MKVPSTVVGRVREPSQAQASFSVPGADANAFGAQIGESAKGLGTAVGNLGEEIERRDVRAANYDAIRKNSERQLKLSEELENLQRNANPNGLDVYQNAEKLIKESEKTYLNDIDPRVRDNISAQMSTTSMQALARARDFQIKQQDAFATQGIEDETTRAKVATKQSPDSATQSIDAVRQHIDSSNLPETVKAQLRRMTETSVREVEYSARRKEGQYDRLTRDPSAAVAIYADKIAQVESGGDPLASNSASSAAGLGQFLNDTWLELISEARPDLVRGKTPAEILALRFDPAISKEMIAEYGMKNAARLQAAGVPASPANLRIAHLLGDTGAVRVLTARPDADISTLVSEKAYKANKGLFDRVPTVKALQDWAREQMGGPLPAAKIEVFQKDGYWTGPGVEYELAGKTRAKPVSREYIERVMPAIFASGEGLGIKITSGGQDPGKGVGSHRHDVNSKGEAATSDFVVTKNGKPIKPGDDPELYAKVLENLAAQGFTGIGHYGWGIHVGGGSRAAWGPSTTSADLDPKFKRAIEAGWARNLDNPTDALDSDLRYANIPFERRQALRADGDREALQDAARRTAEINEANNYKINNFMNAALEGKAGRAEYDTLVSNGVLQDYSKRAAALRLLGSLDGDAQTVAAYTAKMSSPFSTTDPTSKEDKAGLNLLARQNNGLQRIQQLDAGHFTNAILPIVEKSRDIPTEVLGTLEGMVRSNNATQAVFALDALAQLQRTSPKAYEARVDAKLQRDVDYYAVTRRTKPDAELLAKINGGTTQEERQANEILYKRADEIWIAGSEKIRKEVINAVVGSFGIPFVPGTNPDLSVLPWVNETLNKEAQVLFKDAYAQYGDADKAKDAVVKQMNLNWGVNPVGTKNLMKFPPNKAGYQTVGGNYDWIEQNARKELNLQPWQRMELISDEQTEREKNLFGPGRDPNAKPPSYQVVTYDPGGVPRLIETKDQYGKPAPRRIHFVPDPEQKRKEIDYSENVNRATVNGAELKEKIDAVNAAPPGPIKQELEEDLARLMAVREQLKAERRLITPPTPRPDIYEPAPNPMGDRF